MSEKPVAKKRADQTLETFLLKNRKPILAVCLCCILIVVVVCVCVVVRDTRTKKALAAIDSLEFTLVSSSSGIGEEEVSSRLDAAALALESYLSMKGVAGVRANMLAADIAFQKGDFQEALLFYQAAAARSGKTYTYAENVYNAAVCFQQLGQASEALTLFAEAADQADFYLASRAFFNAGRICEGTGDFSLAAEYYQKAVDSHSGEEWASLCQSRLIDLKAKGQID